MDQESNPIHPSLLRRKIIHIDMDAFYASVEIRDNPSLRGKPVIVGGSPQSRGVVSTASYEARKFGVRSAMACSVAAQLCPEAIFVRPNLEKYQGVSRTIRDIFRFHTDLVEPLSLDEAYLDVTLNRSGLYAVQVARQIKNAILSETQLTASAGVAPNKLVAKIASDFRKPDGLTVVLPENVGKFMRPLKLRKIPGVGPVTEKQLAGLGYVICDDILRKPFDLLERELDNRASWLHRASQGLDDGEVETSWVRKSLSAEETFAKDLKVPSEIQKALNEIVHSVSEQMKDMELMGRTVQLKVRYGDFTLITKRRTLDLPFNDVETIGRLSQELLGLTQAFTRPVRLIGVGMSNLVKDGRGLEC